MANIRLIARLDVKGPNLIKGVHLEGLRVIGSPHEHARKYYLAGADEILYMDIVASLYGRNNLIDVVRETVTNVLIPITVGGGIRSVEDAQTILRSGADKVAVNTEATKRPELITELARRFGAQCVVLSIEAKQRGGGGWEAYTDNGREVTGLDVVEWAARGAELGAGEILLTSIDQEGTRTGFDLELIDAVAKAVSVPVIASGGMGTVEHLIEAVKTGAQAIAMADALHYERYDLKDIREATREAGVRVRML
ncbi:MAG TPA: imidazole glycerol phosphate synthase subunit HisF [Rhodospirillales bacterium]|nr:imidazole glycerol phosphate synthase subunit HisF [Rhodospirillales bacterium]